MARRPLVAFPAHLPRQIVRVPATASVAEVIEAVVAASHPAWVDRAQRRRWLQAAASTQRGEIRQHAEVRAACASIGIRIEP